MNDNLKKEVKKIREMTEVLHEDMERIIHMKNDEDLIREYHLLQLLDETEELHDSVLENDVDFLYQIVIMECASRFINVVQQKRR